jgi:hypothetical protein
LDFGELAALTVALEYDIKQPQGNFSLFDFYKEEFDREKQEKDGKKNAIEPPPKWKLIKGEA